MRRVLILGSPGSGKTTLALRLGAATGLPVVHLDRLYWRSGWVEQTKTAWEAQLHEALERPFWIMDGNYGGTLPLRLQAADTAIFLDVPTCICMSRAMRRMMKSWRRNRPDMAPGCPERFDPQFLHYIATFRRRKRPGIMQQLENFSGTVHLLASTKAGEELLRQSLAVPAE